jgi:hypothetical protein
VRVELSRDDADGGIALTMTTTAQA